MKPSVIALAAAGLLACLAPAFAQPAAPAVSPAQIDAAEKSFQQSARAAFRTVRRTPAQRLAAVQAAKPAATVGATTVLTPQAPYAAGKAWLNSTLAIVDTGDGTVAMMAYADEYAPTGSLDVIVKVAPGKRYLVECSAITLGSNAVRATVFGGSASDNATQQLAQTSTDTSKPGSVVSVATPQTPSDYLRISLDVARNTIDSSGQAVLVADKCEVTPFS